MIFWTREDSNNLASIARSLEKLAEREMERNLIEQPTIPFKFGILDRVKEHIKKEQIKVSESPSYEDEVLEESIKHSQRMQNKIAQAKREGNLPFVVEDLFDAEELENM